MHMADKGHLCGLLVISKLLPVYNHCFKVSLSLVLFISH